MDDDANAENDKGQEGREGAFLRFERTTAILIALAVSFYLNSIIVGDRGGNISFGVLILPFYYWWILLPTIILICYLPMSWTGRSGRWFSVRFCFYAIVCGGIVLSLFVGSFQADKLYRQDLDQVKAYVELLADSLDEHRMEHGRYPENLDEIGLEIPVPPLIQGWREVDYAQRRPDFQIFYTSGQDDFELMIYDDVLFDGTRQYSSKKRRWNPSSH